MLRRLYVNSRMSLQQAASHCGVTMATARRWRQRSLEAGDDWEEARGVVLLGDVHFADVARRLLEDYLTQHHATIEMLRADESMDALKRAATLASLADSFNKTMASFKRVTPELDKQAAQMEVLEKLASFVRERLPQHLGALAEILDAAGPHITGGGGA